MTWRTVLLALLTLPATLAGAQTPVGARSPGDQCLADQPQWQTYAGMLKASRDATEQDIAAWRARAEALQRRVTELEKAAAKP